MAFNPQKSQLACFGGNYPRDNIITLGDIYLCWSAQIKYLGCCFRRKQRAVDPSSFTGRFNGTFNNILNVMGNSRNEMSAQYLIQTHYLLSLMYSCETRNFEFVWWKSVLKLLGTMLLGKFSMRIGMKVSNRCSIIALLFLYPSCYPWRNCYFGRKCCVVEIWCADWQTAVMLISLFGC